MKYIAIAALAGLAAASPIIEKRQAIDFAAYKAIPVVPDVAAPLGAVEQEIKTYNKASAATAAVAAATAAVEKAGTATTSGAGSAVQKRNACDPRPSGVSYPAVDGNTDAAFQSYSGFASQATGAGAITGFTTVVTNSMNTASDSHYLGYKMVNSYSPSQCAAACNQMAGCQSFDIYFERDPVAEPGSGCLNPSSLTYIKCAFFGAPLDASSMTNSGGYQADFHVVMAGSNLYTQATPTVPGNFTMQTYRNVAPNAPGYMGVQTFPQTQPYDPSVCASACDAKSDFDINHNLPSASNPDVCNTFIAYMLYQNGGNGVFTCTYYNQPVAASTFVNDGQYDQNGNHYTIGYSHAFPRKCNYPSKC